MTLRRRNLWIGCGMGFVALVVYLSLTPSPIDAPTWESFKVGHILAYCWLMLWFMQIFRGAAVRMVVGVALCLMGIGLEYLQGMTGYRHFAYSDMRDNAIGVVFGFLLASTPLGSLLATMENALLGKVTS